MNGKSYIENKIREKHILIAAHQGTFGGNIGANTISSGKNALLHGADIIEADVTRDKEGVLYMFHDAHEPFNFAVEKHIPEMTTREVSLLTGFNSNGDKCLPAPVRLDERIIYKSPEGRKYCEFVKNCKYPMIFMQIISTLEQAKLALSYGDKVAGFEVLYKTEESDLCSDPFIEMCKDKGIILWSNAMRLNEVDVLAAGHDDNSVIEDGKEEWKWHFGKNFDIVQTDWPALWVRFRDEYFG